MKDKSVCCSFSIRNIFILIILFQVVLGFSFLQAQTFVIKGGPGKVNGVLIDAQTEKPIEAANFILVHFRDTTKVLGTASDKDGRFSLEKIPAGIYNAKISCIGYKTRARKAMPIGGERKETKLDTIKLEPRNFITGEIQITGERDRVIKEKDKYILKPDKELGNNALEFLENAPMVNVDIDDNIKVLGKSAVIYIDGVPAKSMGVNDSRDLKMYSIAEIEKIEVVPEYSPDFPEASEGKVINIVTKKTHSFRYNGYVGTGLSTRNKYDGNAGLNYLMKDASINGNYNKDYSNQSKNNSSVRSIVYNGTENNYEQIGETETKFNSDNFRLTFMYNIDKDNSFTYGAFYRPQTTDNRNLLKNSSYNNNGYSNYVESKGNMSTEQKFFNNNLSVRLGSGKQGAFFFMGGITYMYNTMKKNNDLDQTGSYLSSGEAYGNFMSRDNSLNKNNNLGIRLSANYRVDSTSRIAFFLTSNYQKLSMDNDFYDYDYTKQIFSEKINQKIRQSNDDILSKLIIAFNSSLLGINYSLGCNLDSKISELADDVKNYSYNSDFISIAPAISLTKPLSENSYLTLSYRRNTVNPQNRQLNPYSDYTDSTNIVSGNPDLKPSYSNSYLISYMQMNEDFMVNAGINYSNSSDIIEQITTLDNPKIARTTYLNYGKSESINAGFLIGGRFTSWLSGDFMSSLTRTKYEGIQRKNDNTSFISNLRTSGKVWIFRYSLDFVYNSPIYSAQTKSNSVFYTNASLRALFFEKNLALTLRVTDLFNSRKSNSENFGTGFNFTNKVSETTRVVSFNISFYFQSKANEDFEKERTDEYGDDF